MSETHAHEYVTGVSTVQTFDQEYLGRVVINIDRKKRTSVGESFEASFDDLPEYAKQALRAWIAGVDE